MKGPCLCGDLRCASCGPAQGEYQCGQCGAWASDGGCEEPLRCARDQEQADAAEEAFWRETEAAGAEAVRLGLIPDLKGHWHEPR